MSHEQEQVRRLQGEMEQERLMALEKRKQERDYLNRMMLENEKDKAKQSVMTEKERQEDIRAQSEYARMLEKQEQDRLNEL